MLPSARRYTTDSPPWAAFLNTIACCSVKSSCITAMETVMVFSSAWDSAITIAAGGVAVAELVPVVIAVGSSPSGARST